MWELDCQNFWRAGLPFEVRDVCKEEDIRFIETFATSRNLTYKRQGNNVLFAAPAFARSEAETVPPNPKTNAGRNFHGGY